MSEKTAIESFLNQYGELAIEVVNDRAPNDHIGTPLSNYEMSEYICDTMNWDSFDLFEEYAFDTVYASGQEAMVLAFCFVAFLRWEVWKSALRGVIGDAEFNVKAGAYSQYWYLKLSDKFAALHQGQKNLTHYWIH